MDNERAPVQTAATWSTQANASSSDGDNDSSKFMTRSADDDDVEMDEAHDSGSGLHAVPTAKFVARLVGVEEDESMDVGPSMIDRASLREVEMQGLGPMEGIDDEVFRVESRPLHNNPSAALTKDVAVCKFCNTEFPYALRDVDQHKSTCEFYKQRSVQTTDVTAVEDADLPTLSLDGDGDESAEGDDDTGGGQRESTSSSSSSESEERTDEEEASVKEGGRGGQESIEDDDETQMLDSEPDYHASALDRICEPSEVPTLVVVRNRPGDGSEEPGVTVVASGGDDGAPEVVGQQDEAQGASDVDQGVQPDDMDTGGLDGEAAGEQDEEAVDEESVGNGSTLSDMNGDEAAQANTPNSQYRVIDDDKGDRVECLVCGKNMSNRGSSMTTHRKKCRQPKPTPQDQSISRDDKQLLLLTPQKKPSAKRRITQELDKLEGEVITTEHPFGLRMRKRSKTEGSDTASTPATASTAAATTAKTKRVDDVMNEFVLVGALAQAKRMACKHCKGDVAFRRDQAKKHLGACDAYKTSVGEQGTTPAKRHTEGQTGEQASQKRAKAALTAGGKSATAAGGSLSMRSLEELTVAEILALDAEPFRMWIFGAPQKAADMQSHYRVKSLVVRGPVDRFKAVRDVLCDFDVEKILETSKSGMKVTGMHVSKTSGRPPAIVEIPSTEAAFVYYQTGVPIAFRPPKVVVDMIVPGLAKAVGCGPFVSTETHDVKLICSHDSFKWDWQFHKRHSFVVCLQGKLLWKMQRGPVKKPASSLHAASSAKSGSWEDWAKQLKVLVSAAKVGTTAAAFVPPAGSTFDFRGDDDDGEDMEEAGQSSSQATTPTSQRVVVDAGSVVYMPPGTWYQAEVLEDSGPCMLLQIQLKSGGTGDMLLEALRQVVTTEEWCEREDEAILRDNANQDDLWDGLIGDAVAKFHDLLQTELMPVLLRPTEGAQPKRILGDAEGKSLTKVFEYDLTERGSFQGGKRFRLLEGSMFRVNPLTAMLTTDELTQYGTGTCAVASTALTVAATATTKKALNRKQKRPANSSASANSSESSGQQEEFVFVWGAGDATQMIVKFRCSKPQSVLVEWIRLRDTSDPIHMSELKMVLRTYQGGTVDVELLELLLRFLCSIGYLSNVEVPLGAE